MDKINPLPAKKVIKALEMIGFRQIRQKGSHLFMRHPDGRTTLITVHPGEDIGKGMIKKDLQSCYYPDQRDRMDTFFYELTQADTEEVNTKHGKERRFIISPAHGYAALAYAALPFIDQTMEDVLSAPVRFARGRRF